MLAAFRRGRRSRNLYRVAFETIDLERPLGEVRRELGLQTCRKAPNRLSCR
jgi:hypothetical protein